MKSIYDSHLTFKRFEGKTFSSCRIADNNILLIWSHDTNTSVKLAEVIFEHFFIF